MTPEEIRGAVLSILRTIAPEIDPRTIRPTADLREELDIDSMDFLRFVVQLEARLGVSVPEADYSCIRTLDACVAFLAEHGAALRGAGSGAPVEGS
jgi:acyl carrier protein